MGCNRSESELDLIWVFVQSLRLGRSGYARGSVGSETNELFFSCFEMATICTRRADDLTEKQGDRGGRWRRQRRWLSQVVAAGCRGR